MTTSSIDTYGVVVGVDGSHSSRGALRWAAQWADTHDQRMQVIGAVEHQAHRHTTADLWQCDLWKSMVTVLEREVAHVSEHYPRLRIDKLTAWGSPHQVLADASRNAWTVVVGSRGLHPADSRVPESVSSAAIGQAQCPMIVVPAAADSVPSGGPVVLGCDGSAQSLEATAFAFACASRLGVPLVVVKAPHPDAPPHEGSLCETIQGFGRIYPDVPVTARRADESVRSALCTAADNATLIVVTGAWVAGGGPAGAAARLDLLHRARRPLAFVGASDPRGAN
ncbi:MAG: universal stress protein [Dermatophilaceae bacterium]